MRLLLDENLPRGLTRYFEPQMKATTIAGRGWRGKENGELIRAAQAEFDVFITMDRGIPHQQNLHGLALVILLLEAPSNRLVDLAHLVPEAKEVLRRAQPGDVIQVPTF